MRLKFILVMDFLNLYLKSMSKNKLQTYFIPINQTEYDRYGQPLNYLVNETFKQMNSLEDELLKKVLSEFLQREATLDDARNFTMVHYQGDLWNYDLVFCGIKIGSVRKYFEGSEFKVVFTPVNNKS